MKRPPTHRLKRHPSAAKPAPRTAKPLPSADAPDAAESDVLSPAVLSPVVRAFVEHFGEMGGRWGINRTVGQIYALIFVSPQPLNADDIARSLTFSRSNVSIGLKELQSWRLVRLLHQPGDRREYFEAPEDVWEIFRTLVDERRRREVEPTLAMLRHALTTETSDPAEQHALRRMRAMHDLFALSMEWFDEIHELDMQTVARLMKLGARVRGFLEPVRAVRRRITP